MLTKLCEGALTAAFTVAALLGLGWAVRQGWLLPMLVGLGALGYASFACFTVAWAIQAGGEAAGVKKPLLGNLLYWHGVGIILVMILVVAGTAVFVAGALVLGGMRGR